MLPLLTSSRLKAARACARLDHYRYQIGVRALDEDSEALALGELVHLGLEHWWSNRGNLPEAIEQVRAAKIEDPFLRARAEAMLIGYDARWLGSMADYDVLAVEIEFLAPLTDPETGAVSDAFQLGGKMDAVCREKSTGRTLIVEHKTTAEDFTRGSSYWMRLRLDGQVSQYYRGAAALGFTPNAVLYDVLGKPAQRPLKKTASVKLRQDGEPRAGQRLGDETPGEFRDRLLEAIAEEPDRFYRRGEVVRLENDLKEAEIDCWQTAQQIHDNMRLQRWPRNPDACLRYGRPCDFLSVCVGDATLDDPHRFRRDENFHPELSF